MELLGDDLPNTRIGPDKDPGPLRNRVPVPLREQGRCPLGDQGLQKTTQKNTQKIQTFESGAGAPNEEIRGRETPGAGSGVEATTPRPSVTGSQDKAGQKTAKERPRVYEADSIGDALVLALAETNDPDERLLFEMLLAQWRQTKEKEERSRVGRNRSKARKLLDSARYLLDQGRAWHAYDKVGEAMDLSLTEQETDDADALWDEAYQAIEDARRTPDGNVRGTEGTSGAVSLKAEMHTVQGNLEADDYASVDDFDEFLEAEQAIFAS